MEFDAIADRLHQYRQAGLRLFTSSSFQTHSLVLLHLLSRLDRDIPVYFLHTGYHFPETLRFRDQVTQAFGLRLINLAADVPRHLQKTAEGRLLFTADPDHCCYLNKTQPLEAVLRTHDVWINGVRAEQSDTRRAFAVEQPAPHGVTRFHPMLDWTRRQVWDYIKTHDLPRHPLDAQGYVSIGCEPCTRRPTAHMSEREARWYGLRKQECGLHTDLALPKK